MFFIFSPAQALERPDVEFKIFQFPPNMIPRIDGNTDDWNMVPDSYAIETDQIKDTVHNSKMDKNDLDVSVKVGWVKGLDRLYFLYEAYDDFWDFKHPNLHNDIFEIVVDADLSGGALIPGMRDDKFFKSGTWEGYLYHGVHAQNYHIFTPTEGKPWTMVWGCQPWILELPWSNAAYSYNFKHSESGKLILEFWITPFDYAPNEGPERAVVSKLDENGLIGLSWSILDYDNDILEPQQYDGFWNLSQKTTMYGHASDLVAFRLMPIEKNLRKPIEAQWDFKIIDMDRRLVAFKDMSYGNITSWKWDFGDGATSTEQNPIHQYENPGQQYVVILYVEGPEGRARMSKVWDVAIR
ncbi:MAG: PKD domain-containing protein [Candidatus Latescibacteria bacterium]|nr:PKD domain-containing protein [Candidatus Latescibacterota bacterium]